MLYPLSYEGGVSADSCAKCPSEAAILTFGGYRSPDRPDSVPISWPSTSTVPASARRDALVPSFGSARGPSSR